MTARVDSPGSTDSRRRSVRRAAFAFGCLLAVRPALTAEPVSLPGTIAIEGATLVDLSALGTSRRDLADTVIVIERGRISAAGARGEVVVPAGARRIDARGKFVVPGLIDGFAGMNSEGQARAYLHAGVTTIVAIDDPGGRRGRLAGEVSPRPRLLRLETVGYGEGGFDDTTADGARRRVDELAARGTRVLLLMYPLPPASLAAAVERARHHGLATIGELGATRYGEALALGVQAFVHTSRYSLELASDATRRAVAADPFGPAKLDYYRLLIRELAHGPGAAPWAERLGRAATALIPTAAMEYLDLPGRTNPWLEPEAQLLDPAGIHLPADRRTGKREVLLDAGRDAFPAELAHALLALEARYVAAGARYLAGSGTSAFGTMPGISLRHELELMVEAGLTPRQALAAATSNFREQFGWRELGCVAPGCTADLLVLASDPTGSLTALRSIDALVVDGELVDRAALLAAPSSGR